MDGFTTTAQVIRRLRDLGLNADLDTVREIYHRELRDNQEAGR